MWEDYGICWSLLQRFNYDVMLVLVIWCEWVVVYNQSCTQKVINQEVLFSFIWKISLSLSFPSQNSNKHLKILDRRILNTSNNSNMKEKLCTLPNFKTERIVFYVKVKPDRWDFPPTTQTNERKRKTGF